MIVTTNLIGTVSRTKLTEMWESTGSAHNFMDLPVKERMEWLCTNVTGSTQMNANGGSTNFCTLASVVSMGPLALRPTMSEHVPTYAAQIGIPTTGIFMS